MKFLWSLVSVVALTGLALMVVWFRGGPLIEVSRLILPDDREHWDEAFRSQIPEGFILETNGEPVLVTDPTYLVDVFSDLHNASATYLRTKGVILLDFGGDVDGPVWWKPPFLLIPLSMHLNEKERVPPRSAKVLAQQVGCDSGSFIFLPLNDEVSRELRGKIETVIRDNNGAILQLPAGRYQFFYEQFESPAPNMRGLYRNIVAKRL